MAFWKRKNKERFITLGLNEPSPNAPAEHREAADKTGLPLEPPAGPSQASVAQEKIPLSPPALEPVATGAAPTPPMVSHEATLRKGAVSGPPPYRRHQPPHRRPPQAGRLPSHVNRGTCHRRRRDPFHHVRPLPLRFSASTDQSKICRPKKPRSNKLSPRASGAPWPQRVNLCLSGSTRFSGSQTDRCRAA